MENFIKHEVKDNKIELLIDINIFSKDIILKTSYMFLDRAYFFFKFDENGNIILQLTKNNNKENIEDILADFSSELLSTYLRNNLEKNNKEIREKIVGAAISNSLDYNNYTSINTENNNQEKNEIDFDKDIDDILKEIENDPELKIDEEEIEKILKEIEDEEENEKKTLTIDKDAIEKAKENFKK